MRLVFATLPVLANSHGILLPYTKNFDEAREAGLWSMKAIQDVVETCRDQLAHCSVANLGSSHWESGFQCLHSGHNDLDTACRNKVAAAAQLHPAAAFGALSLDDARRHVGSADDPPMPPPDKNSSNYGCHPETDNPYIWSYHIHLIWDEEGREDSFKFQRAFREAFMGGADTIRQCPQLAFIEDLWNFDSVPAEDIEHHMYADICQQFAMNDAIDWWPSYPPGGPFLHNNTGFTVSSLAWHSVWSWVMKNRPLSDKVWIFNHPNTGCQYTDLRHWSAWAGESTEMYYDILGEFNGCLWAGCNDKQFGCITYRHEESGPYQGYGDCFTRPAEPQAEGTWKLLPGSNTSTIEWTMPSVV
jgi:hypothetical protein